MFPFSPPDAAWHVTLGDTVRDIYVTYLAMCTNTDELVADKYQNHMVKRMQTSWRAVWIGFL